MNFTIPLLTIGDQTNVGKRISVVIHKKRKTCNNDTINGNSGPVSKGKRSRVWDYFVVDPVDPSRGICKICQERVGWNNQTTTPMIRHLKIVHFIIIDTIPKLQNQVYGPTWKCPKTSDVWNYFDRHPDIPEKTICKLCNKLITYKNFGTSSMKQHMLHHKIGKEDEDQSSKTDGRTVKKSGVWEHFDKDPNDPEKTICKHCNKSIVYKNSGTTAMKVHLRHHDKGGPTIRVYKQRQAKFKAEDSLLKSEQDGNSDLEDENNCSDADFSSKDEDSFFKNDEDGGNSGLEDDENNLSEGDLSLKDEDFSFKMSPKQEVEDNYCDNDDLGFMNHTLDSEHEHDEDPPEPEQSINTGLAVNKFENESENVFQNPKTEPTENSTVKVETKDDIPNPVKLNIKGIEKDTRDEKAKRKVTAVMSGRHKSQVWEYFDKDPDNPERTICKVCGKKYNNKNHNTGTMMRHIKEHKEGPRITVDSVDSEEDKSKVFFKKLQGDNRKKKSKIWEYYDRDLENKSMSICKICKERVKYPNWEPWYMEKHLLTEHEIRVRERERWSSKPVKKLNPETGKVEQPVTKTRAEKKREVWNYFTFLSDDNSAVQCKLCQEVIHNKSKYLDGGKLGDQCVRHMNGHNIRLEEQTCSVCGETFDEKTKYNKHMKLHFLTPETGHACKYCGKLWLNKSDKEKHERSHAGEKPFKCSYCGKGHSNKYNCDQHELTHTGDFPFNCDLCGKKFKIKSKFSTHVCPALCNSIIDK